MFELVVILVLVAIDLGGSMVAHNLYVKVNFWYRLMFWASFTFLLYKAGLFEVFKQLLSQKISYHYNKYNSIITNPAIPYKDDGDILFDYNGIKYGKMYDGYVYVVHYDFASTAS